MTPQELARCYDRCVAAAAEWPWRHRGHGWRSGFEMAAAMVVPALAIIGLFWLHVIGSEPLCAVYCVAMMPAMVGAMFYRRSEYGGWTTPAPMAS